MATNELAFTPAWQLRERILRKELSPVEVTDYFLRRIDQLDPRLHAFLTVCGDEAVNAAKQAEAALARGQEVGPLHGLPIPIKDLIPTKGIRTTMGSLIYKDSVPDQDDIIVERIRGAGGIILGKSNTPEFGHRGTTENLLGDACRNPWNPECTAGGSSGGAAAALAAGMCPLAPGSDGGGSIRIPGGFCGVFGIKPTQGRVPRLYPSPGRWGMFSQNGPMAHNVRDAILLFQVMAGPDPRDPTCMQEPVPDFEQALDGDVSGLRIAWSPDYGYAPVDPEVRTTAEAAAKLFGELGAHVEEANPPIDGESVLETFKTFFWSDYLASYGSLLETDADQLDPVVRQGMEAASQWSTGQVMKALHELEWHRQRMARFFDSYDLLLSPVLAVPAFPIMQFPETIDGKSVDPMWGYTPFTHPINMSWQTAATVPCGFSSKGLPIGLHIIGPRGAEVRVLRASAAFEEARPWAQHRPPVS